jgi:stage IV sporulation protein A
LEDGKERLVSTPWFDDKIPFSKAAEIGTEKVISDHSVIGIVVTTDGSFGDIPQINFSEAEEKTVNQLKELHKPFVILMNSATPQSPKSKALASRMEEYYKVPVILTNCQRMTEEEFENLFDKLIYQFPATEIHFRLPGYMDALEENHQIKAAMIENIKTWMEKLENIGQVVESSNDVVDGKIIKAIHIPKADMSTGIVLMEAQLDGSLYYKVIGELMNAKVENDSQLFVLLKEYSKAKMAYDSIRDALEQMETTDYGIIAPKLSEMVLEEPEVFKQGNKFGVRMRAKAPCLHIIKTNISTEVSPVVGSETQSKDLANYLTDQFQREDEDIWETNLFGKSLREMVTEQMEAKVKDVPDVLRGKVQKSLQKISDDGKDYFICIIL